MKKYLIMILFFNAAAFPAFSQEYTSAETAAPVFSLIAEKIDSYKGREAVLSLRLRNIDYTMEKIVFYDAENIDIVFDLSGYRKNKAILSSLSDAHSGVLYSVRCEITGIGQDGLVTGKLLSFSPEFLRKIP
ncbi:MAG: hypothetical protein ACRCUT_13940 [Spirochaetota bacterium]